MRVFLLLFVATTSATLAAQDSDRDTSFLRALSGEMPGVSITASDSAPTTTWLFRCSSSLPDDEQPLFVVDGVALTHETAESMPQSDISPVDIVNVDVMKGREAVERYGQKARYGVIEITTRRGALVSVLPAPSLAPSRPYPNPVAAGAAMTVRVEAAGPVRVTVADALGRRVWTGQAPPGDVSVPTAGLATGAYVVRIAGGGRVESHVVTVR